MQILPSTSQTQASLTRQSALKREPAAQGGVPGITDRSQRGEAVHRSAQEDNDKLAAVRPRCAGEGGGGRQGGAGSCADQKGAADRVEAGHVSLLSGAGIRGS